MQHNDNDTQVILRLIHELIRFRTTPDNVAEFQRAAEFIEQYYHGTSIIVKKHEFNGYPALIISTRDTKRPALLYQGHLDVVNGRAEQFEPTIAGNKLFGRGSVDMKSFVAMAMKIVKDNPQMDVGLMVTFDEETGSENGAKKAFELGYIPELLFNGDGGHNHSVIYGEKGIVKFKVKTLANPGRHPFPWHGKNAFDLFSEDYRKLESLFPQNRIATEEHNWHSTYSLYDVQVVNDEFYGPKSVEAKINVYFTNDTTARDLFESINEEFTNSELSMFTGSERVFLEPDSVHSLSLRRIMERHFGREIALKTDNGSSDARFYAQSHIPIVIAKVVGEDHHGENEHILIDQLLPFYRSMEEFAGSFLQTKKNNEEHLCLCPNTI